MEKFGLMPHHGDYRHPVSRDYAMEIQCGRISCQFNFNQSCMFPSLCKIDGEGKCAGYQAKDYKKEETSE